MTPKFERDTFLLHQRVRAWHDRWRVYDDREAPLLHVERPDKWFGRNEIYAYDDGSKARTLLSIVQTSWAQPFRKVHAVFDEHGARIATLSRGALAGMLHRGWDIVDANGVTVARIRELSAGAALAKRLLHLIPFMRLVTGGISIEFEVVAPDAEGYAGRIGTFGAQYGVPDKYVLDMAVDKARRLDRRIALAAAVLINMSVSK